jgi:hypothetical protein
MDDADSLTRWPTIRPATRTPIPKARPMYRDLIPFMMVAVACGVRR